MWRFVFGFLSGVFVAQTYDVPNLKNYYKVFQDNIKKYEKNEKK